MPSTTNVPTLALNTGATIPRLGFGTFQIPPEDRAGRRHGARCRLPQHRHRRDVPQTWRALEQLHADGRARAIGVSNFQIPHLYRLLEEGEVVPAVNQIELHPGFSQPELRGFHSQQRIATEAWSPLAQGGLLADGRITEIAEAHGRTPAQVILRWHLQLDNVVTPKSVTPARIEENIAVTDFELTEAEMEQIDRLEGERVGPDPDTFGG